MSTNLNFEFREGIVTIRTKTRTIVIRCDDVGPDHLNIEPRVNLAEALHSPSSLTRSAARMQIEMDDARKNSQGTIRKEKT